MKKKLRNIEKRDAAAVKRMQRPQVTEDSSTVISSPLMMSVFVVMIIEVAEFELMKTVRSVG